jgi:GH15 family glucan-1,4-alpha-glucosidase
MKKITATILGLLCAAALTVNAADKGARKELTEDQKKVMKELLEKYDSNKDGKLSPEERKGISADDLKKAEDAKLPGFGTPKKKK